MTQHKWAKEIKAWADGEIIQFLDINGENEWLDCADNSPCWETNDTVYYRIKPHPKEPQYLYVYFDSYINRLAFTKEKSDVRTYTYLGKIKLELEV